MRRTAVAAALAAVAVLGCARSASRTVPGAVPAFEEGSPEEAFARGAFVEAERRLGPAPAGTESPPRAALRARLLAARGEIDGAIAVLDSTLAVPAVEGDDAALLHREAARALLEAGDFARAAARARAGGGRDENDPILVFAASFGRRPTVVTRDESGHVPLRLEPLPEAPVVLNGRTEAFLVVDTAASLVALSRSAARRAGVEVLVEGSRARDPLGGTASVAYGRLDSLEIGEARAEDVPVAILEDERVAFRLLGLFTVIRTEGVIGLDLLRRFAVALDLPAATIRLSPPATGERAATREAGSPFYAIAGGVHLPAIADGARDLLFLLDTGANASSITPEGVEALGEAARVERTVGEVLAVGAPGAYLRRALGVRLALGPYVLPPLDLPVVRAGQDDFVRHGTLGVNALRGNRWVLDFAARRLRLESP